MFEHATLQEAYTGSLIAGKGKSLNNIRIIMDRTRLKTEDWARVRFGAGTPWRRCWCVISPPDEREAVKLQKSLRKKSAYDRSPPTVKGDIKFYDTKKTKKAQPIATIKDAYSAYAIYPQSKPLIDQSTLVKVEGTITIHSTPETTTEGFIFVLPEVHPAVTGFEMMLRWLFPTYDVFALYGRPNRLIADTLDVRSLMFALPQEKRYGYLEIFDVATLIHTDGSQNWSEREWRKRLKELTSERIAKIQANGSQPSSRVGSRRSHRNSLPSSRTGTLRFEDGASMKSTPSLHTDAGPFAPPNRVDSAPPGAASFQPGKKASSHQRSASESMPLSTPRRQRTVGEAASNYTPSRLSYEATPPRASLDAIPPMPPPHSVPPPPLAHSVPITTAYRNPQVQRHVTELEGPQDRSSSESERRYGSSDDAEPQKIHQDLLPSAPPAPVAAPPAFAHQPGEKPPTRPYHSPELRRANSRMSITTLSQLAAAGGANASSTDTIGTPTAAEITAAGAAAAWRGTGRPNDGKSSEDQGQRGVNDDASKSGTNADYTFANQGMVIADAGQSHPSDQESYPVTSFMSQQPITSEASTSQAMGTSPHSLLPPMNIPRSVSPLSQSSTHSSSPRLQESSSPPVSPITRNFSRHSPQPQPLHSQIDTTQHQLTGAEISSTSTCVESQPLDSPSRLSTSKSISRKPLPSPSRPAPALPLPDTRSSMENLAGYAINEDALARIHTNIPPTPKQNDVNGRRPSNSSDYYESTASPDYASTRYSTDTRQSGPSVEKPRAGVLKTVGAVNSTQEDVIIGDIRYRSENPDQDIRSEIPNVDFGPTRIYATGPRNGPDTIGLSSQGRPGSAEHAPTSYQNGGFNETFTGANNSSNAKQGPDLTNKVASRNLVTPEPNTYRSASAGSDNDSPRNVAWQPGTTIGGGSPGSRNSITPEQFVQQRAAANRITPVYAHSRKQSGTPPQHSRNNSTEWSNQARQSPSLHDLPPRPQSRSASTIMNAPTDYSAHLSAREQEHVARVTGSPLINVPANPKQAPPAAGLIGAIEAREKEKKDIKEGLSGQMVQHAIAQRQQQAQGYQYGQPSPSPSMHIPGQYPQTPQTPWPNQQQQQPPNQQFPPQSWTSPGRQVYWNTAFRQPPYQQQTPQYPQAPQYQQGSIQQSQDQYNPYFGNSQGGRQ